MGAAQQVRVEAGVFQPLETAAATGPRHHREALLLALASPMIAELLSSSAPPLQFFVPWMFVLFVLFYGCCALLIREFSVRWGQGWSSILLLGAAFGILDEGLAARAFFDPASRSLGPLASYGRVAGVNWIWSLDATLYHAVFSVALPILLTYQLFPDSRRERWLGKRALWTVSVLFGLSAWVFLAAGHKYPVPRVYIAGCCALMFLLGLMARRGFRSPITNSSRAAVSPRRFAILGFAAAASLLLHIYVVPNLVHSSVLILAILGVLVLAVGRALVTWSAYGAWSKTQQCGLLAGALGFYGFLAFFHAFNPSRTYDATGMSVVGVITLIGLTWMWKRAGRLEAMEPEADMIVSNTYFEAGSSQMPIEEIGAGFPLLAPARWESAAVPVLWRLFEILVAAGALVLTAPMMLALAVLIRRGTPGRALFFQERMGIDGKTFKFVKFRTLYADARKRFPQLYAYQYSEEELQDLKFKIVNDPRVTPQGAWMRKSTLDELPNFWNVLVGDMALVGPRPEIPEMLPYYTGDMRKKFSVRPGITGLAQISGRGRLSFYKTVELDVEYVNTHSVALDLRILLSTAWKILVRDGAF